LAIRKQDVCMVFFNDMNRVGPFHIPSREDIQRNAAKACAAQLRHLRAKAIVAAVDQPPQIGQASMEAVCSTLNPKTPWSSTKSSSILRRRRGNRVETKSKVSTRSTSFGSSAALWFVFDVIGPFLCLAWPKGPFRTVPELQHSNNDFSLGRLHHQPSILTCRSGRGQYRLTKEGSTLALGGRAQRSCPDRMMTLSMLLGSIRM